MTASLVQTRKHGKTTIFELIENSKKIRIVVNVGFTEDEIAQDNKNSISLKDAVLPSEYRALFAKNNPLSTLLNIKNDSDKGSLEKMRDSFMNTVDADTKFVVIGDKYLWYVRNINLPFSGAKIYIVDGYFFVKDK